MITKPNTLLRIENNPFLAQEIAEDVGPRVLQIIEAAISKPLNRYNLRPGRIFGNMQRKERYKIVQLSGDIVVYKEVGSDRLLSDNVNDLIEKWNLLNVVEISPIDSILEKLKSWLSPFLGTVLVAALIAWLLKKLG